MSSGSLNQPKGEGYETADQVLLNDGQGNFIDSKQRLLYSERHGLAVGDFNGDSYLDVFAAAGEVEFQLWLNQGDGRMEEGSQGLASQ